ncbi:hypothetical protein MBANPS3_010643 [Mucor bainieri]
MDSFQNEIVDAHKSLRDAEVSIASVIGQLQDVIVNAYDGVWFEDYKAKWVKTIYYDYFKAFPNLVIGKTRSMLGYTIASMVIAKLCSNDYDFKGKGRATPKATSAASSTEPQVFAVPQGPVRTPVSIIPKATSPGCATAKAANTTKAKTTGPPPAAASLCEFPASSTSTSTSTLGYQRPLEEQDYKELQSTHDKITAKWRLSCGTMVEDVMYSKAKTYSVEHPHHSYIVNWSADRLIDLFSKEQIDEIEQELGESWLKKDLPPELSSMLSKLNGKVDFNTINSTYEAMSIDRRQEPALYWCKMSILNYLNLFVYEDHVQPFPTEQDLLKQMYGFIELSRFISKTTTETGAGSCSSTYNKNSKRTLSTMEQMNRQAVGDRSDLTFKYQTTELGCLEIGLIDHGPSGTKELQESSFKTPKMMRNFCRHIIDQYKVEAQHVKIVSFIISGQCQVQGNSLVVLFTHCLLGPYISAEVMTFKGCVGVLYSSPRLKMPENIAEIPRLLPPVLALVFNCSIIMKETVQFLVGTAASVNLDPFANSEYFFPDAYIPSMSNKKRKSVSSSSE